MMSLFRFFKKDKPVKMTKVESVKVDTKKEVKPKASNKRKTIPKEVKELLAAGKETEVKEIMKKCQINAYDTFTKNTIISYRDISDDLVRYFVLDQGYDINYVGYWEKTPLHHQAGYLNSNVALFLELGANVHAVDYMNETPLHQAAMARCLLNVQTLVEAGAEINQLSSTFEMTPLHELVARMHLYHDDEAIPCIVYLLAHGAKITPKIKDTIKRLGTDFEFHRQDIKQNVELMEANLVRLYDIFDVEPVPRRIVYDGKSLIHSNRNRWQDQHQELWALLVPGNGHASTVQGELIRISGKVSREILDNGACNWDSDYREMMKAVPTYFAMGNVLDGEKMQVLSNSIAMIKKGQGEEELSTFTQLAVEWVQQNPEPIALTKVLYKR